MFVNYSAMEETMFPNLDKYQAKISHEGEIEYNFPTTMESICPVNVRYFPFDKQSCPMRFGSWSYTGQELDVQFLNPEGKQKIMYDTTVY